VSSPLPAIVPFPSAAPSRVKEVLARALRQLLAALKAETLTFHVPRLTHLYESRKTMPYHFKPEIFIQLSGTTEFTFPEQRVALQPGSVCLVPRGMPHGELARADGAEFENLVISFYNGTIYVHLAHERAPGRPAVDNVHFFATDHFDDLILFLDRIAELHSTDAARHGTAIRALLVAEFSLLAGVVEVPAHHLPPANDTIALCKWLIHQRLHDDTLNLESLSTELGCSSSYLSRLFHRKVGERIVEHINRLRIRNAMDALQQTRHSVKVIAAGCGYRDAGYFGRLFRQSTSRSPQQYRREAQRAAATLETEPKTVYAQQKDHGAVPDLGELNAIDALRLTKLSVKAIAAGCGYRDVKLFTRFFRQATGTSPQKYRREIQHAMSSGHSPFKDSVASDSGARVRKAR
jgi:AraC-like DNA-binding protein/quercetin dioxygenase-like cupin family protein